MYSYIYIDNDISPFQFKIKDWYLFLALEVGYSPLAFFFLQRLRGRGLGGKKDLRALFSFKNTLTCFYVYKLKFYTHVNKV